MTVLCYLLSVSQETEQVLFMMLREAGYIIVRMCLRFGDITITLFMLLRQAWYIIVCMCLSFGYFDVYNKTHLMRKLIDTNCGISNKTCARYDSAFAAMMTATWARPWRAIVCTAQHACTNRVYCNMPRKKSWRGNVSTIQRRKKSHNAIRWRQQQHAHITSNRCQDAGALLVATPQANNSREQKH